MPKQSENQAATYLEQLKVQASALRDHIIVEDMEDQPTLSKPPRIKIHQANSKNAPKDSTFGWFYSDSSFCPPSEMIRAIIFKQNDGRRKSTKYGSTGNHIICACAVSESMQGIPFVPGENDKWHPGETVRDCWFCPDYLPGKGMPKLEKFKDDTPCTTYRQLALNLLIDDQSEVGIPAKLEYGASIFKKEYTSMSPFDYNGVIFGPGDFLTYNLKVLGVPMHSAIVQIMTVQIETDKGVVFTPIFGIERLLSPDGLVQSRAFAHDNLSALALTGKSALLELEEEIHDDAVDDDDTGVKAPGDAYNVAQYSAPAPIDEPERVF